MRHCVCDRGHNSVESLKKKMNIQVGNILEKPLMLNLRKYINEYISINNCLHIRSLSELDLFIFKNIYTYI